MSFPVKIWLFVGTMCFILCVAVPIPAFVCALSIGVSESLVWIHPLPDGHVYRDVQVVVDDEKVSVDVRLSSSDVTWIELIAKADREFTESQQQVDENSESDEKADAEKSVSVSKPLNEVYSEVKRSEHLPLPTTEDEVSDWLTLDDNRRVLKWWIAKHVAAKWNDRALVLNPEVKSRQNGRHHWAISIELEFLLPESELDDEEQSAHESPAVSFEVEVDAFKSYPGQVRRAIKTRGDCFLEETDLPAVIVRADFEELNEKSTEAERTETIAAKIRFE